LTGHNPHVEIGFVLSKTPRFTLGAGQKRGVYGVIKRELRRRSAIEPIIGHLKAEGHLGRCYLKGRAGDASNVVLSAVGHNFRRIIARLRELLCLFLVQLSRTLVRPAPDQFGFLADDSLTCSSRRYFLQRRSTMHECCKTQQRASDGKNSEGKITHQVFNTTKLPVSQKIACKSIGYEVEPDEA
jgi:hypothetical protein